MIEPVDFDSSQFDDALELPDADVYEVSPFYTELTRPSDVEDGTEDREDRHSLVDEVFAWN